MHRFRTLILFTSLQILFAFNSHGQELQTGLEYGVITDAKVQFPASYVSAHIDYQFSSSQFAVGFKPGIIIQDNSRITGNIPLSVKYHFGELWNLSPELGVFYWTTGRGGMTVGISLERRLKDKWIPYLNGGYWSILYKDGISNVIESLSAINLGIGLKYVLR
ncbi:MAG: hypothetical protein ACO2Z9_03580 [Crocinitomicaceae bacterium]